MDNEQKSKCSEQAQARQCPALPGKSRPGWGWPRTNLPQARPQLLIIDPRGPDQMPFKVSYAVWAPEEVFPETEE